MGVWRVRVCVFVDVCSSAHAKCNKVFLVCASSLWAYGVRVYVCVCVCVSLQIAADRKALAAEQAEVLRQTDACRAELLQLKSKYVHTHIHTQAMTQIRACTALEVCTYAFTTQNMCDRQSARLCV